MSAPTNIPGPCPLCGAISIAPATQRSTLLAVCDVLCMKALEKLGNYLIRAERSRFNVMASHPTYTAHSRWPASDELVTKALRGAWDVVPALLDIHGCCDITALQVTRMLDGYVHDLAITGTLHTIDQLAFRFTSELGLPVFDNTHPHPHAADIDIDLERAVSP